MTKLGSEDSVTRETLIEYRGKPLIVTLTARAIVIKVKRDKTEFVLPLDAAFDLAMKLGGRKTKRKDDKEDE